MPVERMVEATMGTTRKRRGCLPTSRPSRLNTSLRAESSKLCRRNILSVCSAAFTQSCSPLHHNHKWGENIFHWLKYFFFDSNMFSFIRIFFLWFKYFPSGYKYSLPSKYIKLLVCLRYYFTWWIKIIFLLWIKYFYWWYQQYAPLGTGWAGDRQLPAVPGCPLWWPLAGGVTCNVPTT